MIQVRCSQYACQPLSGGFLHLFTQTWRINYMHMIQLFSYLSALPTGWLKTMSEYFRTETKGILDNMIAALMQVGDDSELYMCVFTTSSLTLMYVGITRIHTRFADREQLVQNRRWRHVDDGASVMASFFHSNQRYSIAIKQFAH